MENNECYYMFLTPFYYKKDFGQILDNIYLYLKISQLTHDLDLSQKIAKTV